MGTLILTLVVLVAYCAPTLTAFRREHPHAGVIAVLNLALGWTIVGWAVAMGWANTDFRGR